MASFKYLVLLVTSLVSLVHAQQVGPSYGCYSSAPEDPPSFTCTNWNATFKELAVGKPVGAYAGANWTALTVRNGPHITPYSTPNDAATTPGSIKSHVLPSFSTANGTGAGILISNFAFACTARGTLDPVPCTLNVTGFFEPTDSSSQSFTSTVTYTPNGKKMQEVPPSQLENVDTFNINTITFDAVDSKGDNVNVYLDSVQYTTMVYGACCYNGEGCICPSS